MYILFESNAGHISNASIYNVDIMGAVTTETEAMEWRNDNIEYREYKYMNMAKANIDCNTACSLACNKCIHRETSVCDTCSITETLEKMG